MHLLCIQARPSTTLTCTASAARRTWAACSWVRPQTVSNLCIRIYIQGRPSTTLTCTASAARRTWAACSWVRPQTVSNLCTQVYIQGRPSTTLTCTASAAPRTWAACSWVRPSARRCRSLSGRSAWARQRLHSAWTCASSCSHMCGLCQALQTHQGTGTSAKRSSDGLGRLRLQGTSLHVCYPLAKRAVPCTTSGRAARAAGNILSNLMGNHYLCREA